MFTFPRKSPTIRRTLIGFLTAVVVSATTLVSIVPAHAVESQCFDSFAGRSCIYPWYDGRVYGKVAIPYTGSYVQLDVQMADGSGMRYFQNFGWDQPVEIWNDDWNWASACLSTFVFTETGIEWASKVCINKGS